MAEPLANAVARKTAILAPKITCVSVMVDSLRRTQGRVMTGCGTLPDSSPRCAASCCTHHWQIFLKDRGGSCRPHRIQFAMSYTKVSAVEWVVGSTEHTREVDERSELERFTGAEAQIECASDAALKGRSSTVRDRLGSATRMLCRGSLPGRFPCSRMRRFAPQAGRGGRADPTHASR